MDERQPNQEYAQTGINTPVSTERTPRFSGGSSGQRIRSAGSSAVTSKRFGADSDAITPATSATAERAYAADSLGSVLQGDHSSKREDLELRSRTRPKRVISVSGGLLSGPARRGRRRQTKEDAEAYGEELPLISAALDSPFQTKDPSPAAMGKRESVVRLSDMHANRTASNSELPHHESVPLPDILSVHAKEVQASMPANARRASIRVLNEEVDEPASSLSLDPESFAPPQAPISSERRASAVKSQSSPYLPEPSLPPPKTFVVETLTGTQSIKKRQLFMKVNGRAYKRRDCIGRGGLGKVYRVATANGNVMALKRVSLLHMDELTEKGLIGEIELLERMQGVERAIQLIDYESNREKLSLSVLMEVGELDFDSLLKNRQSRAKAPAHSFDVASVRYYWKEMLECVRAIHERAVVHSDLKPANFVLVKGQLKLIDFGIANAIETDITTNVYRESMAGTVSYMSPESLMDSAQYAFTVMQNGQPYMPASGAPRTVKVGKPSDSHHIDIPATTEDGSYVPVALLLTMRRCLSRDQKDRPTCETLLSEANDFLYPQEYDEALSAPRESQFLPMTEELLGRVIQSVKTRCEKRPPADDKTLATWTTALRWAWVEDPSAGMKLLRSLGIHDAGMDRIPLFSRHLSTTSSSAPFLERITSDSLGLDRGRRGHGSGRAGRECQIHNGNGDWTRPRIPERAFKRINTPRRRTALQLKSNIDLIMLTSDTESIDTRMPTTMLSSRKQPGQNGVHLLPDESEDQGIPIAKRWPQEDIKHQPNCSGMSVGFDIGKDDVHRVFVSVVLIHGDAYQPHHVASDTRHRLVVLGMLRSSWLKDYVSFI
ncbi:hypothetical protein G7046_g4845 [Stylonectria norvegica]|nr:hypothetical protein G7046_g4845 [Stylonectria norvegica]